MRPRCQYFHGRPVFPQGQQYHPGQQYRGQHGQQYRGHPGQQYRGHPGQQYTGPMMYRHNFPPLNYRQSQWGGGEGQMFPQFRSNQ